MAPTPALPQQQGGSPGPQQPEVEQEEQGTGCGAQQGSPAGPFTSRKIPALGAEQAERKCKQRSKEGPCVSNLTMDVLRPHFFVNRQEAANKLGVCVNTIKSACAIVGIKRWPFRKLQGLNQRLKELPRDTSEVERRALYEEMEKIIAEPNREEDSNELLETMKRRHYKRRYYNKRKQGRSRRGTKQRESPAQSQDSTEVAAETTGRQYKTRGAQLAAAAAACEGSGAVDSHAQQPKPKRARGGVATLDCSDEDQETDSGTPEPGSPSELGSSPPGELAVPQGERGKPGSHGSRWGWHLGPCPEEGLKPDVSAVIFHSSAPRNQLSTTQIKECPEEACVQVPRTKPPPITVKDWAEEEHAHGAPDRMASGGGESTHPALDCMALSPEIKRKAAPRTSASSISHEHPTRELAHHACLPTPTHCLSLLSPSEVHPTRSSSSVIPDLQAHSVALPTPSQPSPQQQQQQAHTHQGDTQRAQHAQLRGTHSTGYERMTLGSGMPLASTLSMPQMPEFSPPLSTPQLCSLPLSEQMPAQALGGGGAGGGSEQQQQQQQQQCPDSTMPLQKNHPHEAHPHPPQLTCRTGFALHPLIAISPVSSFSASPMHSDAVHASVIEEEHEHGAATCRSDGVLSAASHALYAHSLCAQAHSNSSSGSQFRLPTPPPPAPGMLAVSKSSSLPTVVQSMHNMREEGAHRARSMHSTHSVGSGPPSFLSTKPAPDEGRAHEGHAQHAQRAQSVLSASNAAAHVLALPDLSDLPTGQHAPMNPFSRHSSPLPFLVPPQQPSPQLLRRQSHEHDRPSSMLPFPHATFVPVSSPLAPPPPAPPPPLRPTQPQLQQQQQPQQQKQQRSARTGMDKHSVDKHSAADDSTRAAQEAARLAQRQRNFIELSKELMLRAPKLAPASSRGRARTHTGGTGDRGTSRQGSKHSHTTRPQSRALRTRAGASRAVSAREPHRLVRANSTPLVEPESTEDALISAPAAVENAAGLASTSGSLHGGALGSVANHGVGGSWHGGDRSAPLSGLLHGGALDTGAHTHGVGGSWHGGDRSAPLSGSLHGGAFGTGAHTHGVGGSWHGGDRGAQLSGYLHIGDSHSHSQHGPAGFSRSAGGSQHGGSALHGAHGGSLHPDLPAPSSLSSHSISALFDTPATHSPLPPVHVVRPQQHTQPLHQPPSTSTTFPAPSHFFLQPPPHPAQPFAHPKPELQSPLEQFLQSLDGWEPDHLGPTPEECGAQENGDLSMQDLMMGGLGPDLAISAAEEQQMVDAHNCEHEMRVPRDEEMDQCLQDAMADFLDDLPEDLNMLQPALLPGLHASSERDADARGQDNYLASQSFGLWDASPRLL